MSSPRRPRVRPAAQVLQQQLGWESRTFPQELCRIPNPREPLVLDSDVPFLCLIHSRSRPDCAYVRTLYPYTWGRAEGARGTLVESRSRRTLKFGWVDQDGNIMASRIRCIHAHDDAKVVSWFRLDGKTTPEPLDGRDPEGQKLVTAPRCCNRRGLSREDRVSCTSAKGHAGPHRCGGEVWYALG